MIKYSHEFPSYFKIPIPKILTHVWSFSNIYTTFLPFVNTIIKSFFFLILPDAKINGQRVVRAVKHAQERRGGPSARLNTEVSTGSFSSSSSSASSSSSSSHSRSRLIPRALGREAAPRTSRGPCQPARGSH